MKRLITICFAIGIALAMTSIAGADATSNSRAVLDWSTFSLSYTGTDIDWDFRESSSGARAEDKNSALSMEYMWLLDWGDTDAIAEVPNAWGEAWTTDMEVGEEVCADTIGQGLFWAFSRAGASRRGDFVAAGYGTLTVSIDYSLEQILVTQVFGDWADGSARAGLFLDNWDSPWDEVWDSDGISPVHVVDGASFSDSRSGTFTVSLDFWDGDTGSLEVWVDNDAYVESVPAPGAILLGILGLGVAGVKLRKFA